MCEQHTHTHTGLMKMDETAHTLLFTSWLMMSPTGQRLEKHHVCNFFFHYYHSATFSQQKNA